MEATVDNNVKVNIWRFLCQHLPCKDIAGYRPVKTSLEARSSIKVNGGRSLNTSQSLIQLSNDTDSTLQSLIQKIRNRDWQSWTSSKQGLATLGKNWQPSSTGVEWTLIPILNGEMGKKTLGSINPTNLISSVDSAIWRKRTTKPYYGCANTTTDSLLTHLSTPTIL